MFDSKMLLVILAIALVIFGTKRLRSIGTDLGAAVKGFKQAMNDGAVELDMVVNIGKVLTGDWAYVEEDVSAVLRGLEE